MATIHHALCLNLHQPSGNLEFLLDHRPEEARDILRAMGRLAGFLDRPEGVRLNLSLSGTLLESLSNPELQTRVAEVLDCGALFERLRSGSSARVLATAYYHPLLPLIPAVDRGEHLARWLGIGSFLFGREQYSGFWPPELGFSMDMIPLLVGLGFRYVMVDSDLVEAVTPMSWESLRYRPHWASYEDARIQVVVRDRELSDALERGMDYGAFQREAGARTEWCDFEPLVTTATDGENGPWFRDLSTGFNFWDAFLSEATKPRQGGAGLRQTFIEDYLEHNAPYGEVYVHTGARGIGWQQGRGFERWAGSPGQKELLRKVGELSGRVHEGRWFAGQRHIEDATLWHELEGALWRVLRSQTSCNLVWGDEGLERARADLNDAAQHLEAALRRMA